MSYRKHGFCLYDVELVEEIPSHRQGIRERCMIGVRRWCVLQ